MGRRHRTRSENSMSLRRREFLTKGVLATGAVAAGATGVKALVPTGERVSALTVDGRLVQVDAAAESTGPVARALRDGVPGRRWVMVIDLAVCDGCDDCVVVCRDNHAIPTDREWIRIYRMQDSEETAPYWFPKPCYHCDNPPCAKVCPVGATFKRTDGLVLVDSERCIGCRFCMAACPYSSRVFNWHRPTAAETGGAGPHDGLPRRVGTVEKCDFCADSIAHGELPHCATVCTMGAMYFGDANEDAVTNGKQETVRLSELLHDRSGYRFLEDLGTEPRVYYLPPRGRRYPAPPRPHRAHGAATAPAPPVAPTTFAQRGP
jgi:Fe-S-cluster-containing dehydrogenase component